MKAKAVTGNPKRKKEVLYFILSFAVALGLTWILVEPFFSDSQVYALFLLFFVVGLWTTEAVPPFAVSLFIIAYLVFAMGNKHINSSPENIEKYTQSFSSSVIWLMLGGFFLASAMTKTKLDESLLKLTLKISGTNPRNLLISLMFTTMFASMLMSNTATTAMVITALMPLLVTMDKNSGITKALLIGIPMAATIGGMGTIIGTPANAIAVGALEHAGIHIGFIDWIKYGVPISILLTAISSHVLIKIYIKDILPLSLDFIKKQNSDLPGSILYQRRIVIIVTLVTVALWLTTSIHGLTVASVCAVPLVFLTLLGVLDSKDIQRLPWDTLLLVAGGLSLGISLEQTGLLNYYAQKLISMDINFVLLIFIFGFVTMIVSNIMSNTAASTVMIPLGMVILVGFKTDVALTIALSSSTAMFLPVSTPPNAIAYSTGLLEQKDFRIGGILIGLLGPLLTILWVLYIS